MIKNPIKLKLLPSLKEKKHYLAFKGEKEKVEEALSKFLGILGMAKANPQIIEAKNGKGILSFNRQHADEIKTALVFSGIHTLGVSGTINRLRQKFL